MLIEGEKYACEACVRGHRVSTCQHQDRPLLHINKKGRPVTQCQHCRNQRKNRSTHVKCDCGEKTTKCVHLGAKNGHRESCCCNHGGECSCAGYKNDLDTVPETANSGFGPAPPIVIGAAPKSPVRRNRANTSRSEGTHPKLDDHSRHKALAQKRTKAASRKTLPYPANGMNTSRSIGHLRGFMTGNGLNTDDDVDENLSNGNTGSESGADDACSAALAAGAGLGTSSSFPPNQIIQLAQQQQQEQEQQQQQQQRRSWPDTDTTPFFAAGFPLTDQLANTLTLDMNGIGNFSTSSNMATLTPLNTYGSDSSDPPLFSAGVSSPPSDWANFNHGFNAVGEGNVGSMSFLLEQAYTLEQNAPTMTTGTSGAASEADDNTGPPDFEPDFEVDFDSHADTASSNMDFSGVNSGLQLSNSGIMEPAIALGGDSGELRHSKAGNEFLSTPFASALDELSTLNTFKGEDQQAWPIECPGGFTDSPEADAFCFLANLS